jgi:hypothetical protein
MGEHMYVQVQRIEAGLNRLADQEHGCQSGKRYSD